MKFNGCHGFETHFLFMALISSDIPVKIISFWRNAMKYFTGILPITYNTYAWLTCNRLKAFVNVITGLIS